MICPAFTNACWRNLHISNAQHTVCCRLSFLKYYLYVISSDSSLLSSSVTMFHKTNAFLWKCLDIVLRFYEASTL